MPEAAKVAHDPAVIARLEAEALQNPRAYRARLGAIALAGDLVLTTTQVLPWAAPIVIGVLLINVKLFYWLGAAAVFFLAWLFRPTFRFDGRELTIEEAPRLHEEMGRLRRELRVPARMRVYLDDSFNASAAETRGLFGLLGTRCGLTLGVPLLAVLTREQLLAVIAHEFGHFSRRHGRLGQWLYRARVGWIQYAKYVGDSDSSFDRAAAWYAQKFVPFFSARSFVHSRQCEYEADADAALAVGARPVAEALTRIAVIARLWEKQFARQLAQWQLAHPEPPRDYHEQFQRFANDCGQSDMRQWLDDALREPSSWHDTHPSLSERLRALAQDAVLAQSSSSAAEALLGEQWPAIVAEFDLKWANEVRPQWLFEHLRRRHIAQPLLSADGATTDTWSVDLKLARARALRESSPALGLAELRKLCQANPSHRRVRFAYAAALLNEDDESGVVSMEALAREDPAFRAAAFSRVLAYFERKGDLRQIERWSAWLKRVTLSLEETVSTFLAKAEAGEGRASSLPPAELTVVSEAARLDPSVTRAWLVEGRAGFSYAADRPAVPLSIHLLVLAIDPAEAKRLDQDEESIARRYEGLLGMLIPPEALPLVRTYFTTETIPAAYGARSDISLDTQGPARLA